MRSLTILLVVFLSSSLPAADLARELSAALKAGSERELCRLLEDVGSVPSRSELSVVLQIGVETASTNVYACVRKALASVESPRSIDLLGTQLLRSRDPRLRALALFALTDIPDPEAVKPLLKALKKTHDANLRIQVARALGKKQLRESVDALIDVLEMADKTDGEFSATVRRSLYSLTLRNFATVEDWEKWWKFEREAWQPPTAQTRGMTQLKASRPPGKFPKFFGVEIYSVRVVFIIDVSGSMNEGVRGFDISRMELVQRELIQALKDLQPRVRFSVIAFSSKVNVFSEELVEATPANKEKALRFARALTSGGETWTQDALESAFRFDDANTFVLLSDGSPFKNGDFMNKQDLLDWVELANRFRQVTIHTVGFPEAYVPFLRALSQQNGGEYHNALPPENLRVQSPR